MGGVPSLGLAGVLMEVVGRNEHILNWDSTTPVAVLVGRIGGQPSELKLNVRIW